MSETPKSAGKASASPALLALIVAGVVAGLLAFVLGGDDSERASSPVGTSGEPSAASRASAERLEPNLHGPAGTSPGSGLSDRPAPSPISTPSQAPEPIPERAVNAVALRVLDLDGHPILNAEAWRFDPANPGRGRSFGRTDEGGALRVLPGLLRVQAPDHVSAVTEVPAGPAHEVRLARGERRSGVVVAAEDGRPIAGAEVLAPTSTGLTLTRSDAAGRFALVLPAGKAELLVTAPARPALAWTSAEGSAWRVEVPLGVGVTGQVRRADGRPAAGAQVVVIGEGQAHRGLRARCDARGAFRLPSGLHPGQSVCVIAWDSDASTPLDPLWRKIDAPLEITLTARATVTLEAATQLRLVPLHRWPGVADAAEAPLVEGSTLRLAAGRYRWEDAQGAAHGPESITLEAGGEERLRAPAPASDEGPTRSVRAYVVDAQGAPLAGVRVTAQSASGASLASALSDERGEVLLALRASQPEASDPDPGPDPASPGAITLRASASGRVSASLVLSADADAPTLRLPLACALKLRVLPPQAVDVFVLVGEVELSRGRTAANGELDLKGLPLGEIRVQVETADGRLVTQSITLPALGRVDVSLQR